MKYKNRKVDVGTGVEVCCVRRLDAIVISEMCGVVMLRRVSASALVQYKKCSSL